MVLELLSKIKPFSKKQKIEQRKVNLIGISDFFDSTSLTISFISSCVISFMGDLFIPESKVNKIISNIVSLLVEMTTSETRELDPDIKFIKDQLPMNSIDEVQKLDELIKESPTRLKALVRIFIFYLTHSRQ